MKKKIKELLLRFKKIRTCPICNWNGASFDYGGAPHKRRIDCRCPKCGSLERHRLAFMIAENAAKLDYESVVHVAPEKVLSKWLKSKSHDYLSIDLHEEAMMKMDITDLKLNNNSKTLFWVSHVFEHIEDDAKAISEIYRVLKPGGVAYIQVPIWRLRTYENFSIKSKKDREIHFYQTDHVRLYGLDIIDRFEASGFQSTIHRAQDFGPQKLIRYGLSFASTNEVFVFKK